MAADVVTGGQARQAAELMAGLSLQSRDVTAKILQVLAEAAAPLSTGEIEEATGYGIRHGQLCYRMLCRLARLGALIKITWPDVRSRYWQLPAASLPPAGGRKAHAYLEIPPWRTARSLTACRLEIADVDTVLPWDVFDQMVQAEKASSTPFWESRVCCKCAYEPKSGRVTWSANPVLVVAKSPQRLVFSELRALAALAAARPDELALLLEAEQVVIALGGL
jgi:hypothetical protein